eukprot:TRINITY_DN1555_c0_g1_i1.p1 TRINITY_DN1555_c0_g1~~TRINITY_DN1555_c0_g1_i1.p1  ORF type:complete len:546 (-),score=134.66 TRINITY_DN1555_c0_g1_i1:74-1711(-)
MAVSSLTQCEPPSTDVSAQSAKGFFIFVAITVSLLTTAVCAAIYLRKHVQVLRIRRPWTVCMTLISFSITTVMACAKAVDFVESAGNISCTGYWYSYAILNGIIFTSIIIRAWITIFMFNLHQSYASFARRRTTVKEEEPASPSSQPRGHNWYFENSRLLKSRFMLVVIFAGCSLFILSTSIYFAIYNRGLKPGAKTSDISGGDCGCMSDYGSFMFIDLLVGILVVLSFFFLLRKLNDVSENFFIKEELYNQGKIVVGIGIFVVILFFPKRGITVPSTVTVIIHIIVRFFVPNVVLLWVSGLKTVQLTYLWEKGEDTRKIEDGNILSKLIPLKPTLNEMREEMFNMLFDEQGFRVFQQFLVKEFSVENILFWKEAKEFREFARRVENGELLPADNMTMDQLWAKVDEKGRNVYKSYCSEEAVLLINLPFAIQNKLRAIFAAGESDSAGLKRAPSTRFRNASSSRHVVNAGPQEMSRNRRRIHSEVFAEAMTEITNLMCSDSFRRFRMLDDYREYVLERHHKSASAGTVNLDLRGQMVVSVPEGEV